MSWIWVVIGIISAVIVVLVAGFAISYGAIRRQFRRQLAQQATEAEGFPGWAEERGYAYSETFPADDIERFRGLGALLPFSDFALSRAEHVFSRIERGKARYLLQLTICADPGPEAPAVGAITVAVAEVARTGRGAAVTDIKHPGASRDEASVHAHGRWITSYIGRPLTLTSLGTVEDRLEQYLQTA
ncbi:hypothetical protein [Brevibacterium album]|uniref:hypothetical protein n=1 Tax=Brevibacterium album TaxID=417948 RepID=UPI000400676D|nr:hypothetical protein [Brevibacterium album]